MNCLEALSKNSPNNKGAFVNTFIKYFILCSNILNIAVANEEVAHVVHEPSIFDLKYAVLNFVVLFGFLGWKLKKPLQDMFDKKSEDVQTLMTSAERQSKDAEARLNEFHAKIKNLHAETTQINSEYESDTLSFAKNLHEETQTSIARMQRDLHGKLEGEKKELLDELNHELLSKIIAKTKNDISTNPEHQKNATKKIITELN